MNDLGRIEGFDWDSGNLSKSTDKHGVTLAESEHIFFNDPVLVVADDKHSAAEARYHALGATLEGRLLHITFTLRADGKRIRVISARDMHRKEKVIYEKQTR